jgi:hypothetical protein
MINYKFQINYNFKNQIESMWEFLFVITISIATRVSLKDLTHMLCLQYLISQTI